MEACHLQVRTASNPPVMPMSGGASGTRQKESKHEISVVNGQQAVCNTGV